LCEIPHILDNKQVKIVKNHVRSFYDRLALKYDEEQEFCASMRVPEKKIVMETLEKIFRSDQTALDIGAGTGRFAMMIAPRVKHVTAVDISQKMLDQLALKKRENNLENIEQIHGNFMEINFKKRFDLIVSFSSIEYFKEQDALFKKIGDLLNPGGRLVLTTIHNTFFRWWGRLGNYFRQKIFLDAYSKKRMAHLLTANGLKVVEIKDLIMKSLFSKGILLFVHAEK